MKQYILLTLAALIAIIGSTEQTADTLRELLAALL